MSARPAEIPCSSVRFISCNMICVKLRFNCLCVRHLTHMVFQLNLLAKASLTVAASSGCRMLGLMDLLVLVSRFQSLSLCIVNSSSFPFTLHRLQFTIVSMLQLCYVSISFGPWVIHMCVGDLARFAHHLLLQRLLQVVMAWAFRSIAILLVLCHTSHFTFTYIYHL